MFVRVDVIGQRSTVTSRVDSGVFLSPDRIYTTVQIAERRHFTLQQQQWKWRTRSIRAQCPQPPSGSGQSSPRGWS